VGRGDDSIADTKTANEAPSEASAASRQLKVLEDIAVFDARTDDHQEALEGVVRLVAEAMDCEVCSLYSYDSQTATLSLAATVGLPARSIGRVSMGHGEGLVGLVVEQNDVVTAEDALTHKRFKFFPELGEEKYHGFLGVPVGDGDAILGVLVLQARRRRKFGEDDVRLLRAVGGQVRGLMLNAHLTDRLQREEAEREVYRRNMVRAIRRLEAYEQARKKPGAARRDQSFVRLTGQAASPGFGIGKAHIVRPQADIDRVETRTSDDPAAEISRFEDALARSCEDVEVARKRMRELVPEVGGAIYEALRMVIEDRSFARRVKDHIGKGFTAETALRVVIGEYVLQFEEVDDSYLRERAVDVRDAGQRVLGHLLGVEGHCPVLTEDTILVAGELTLSDLSSVEHSKLKGIVTGSGGETSHAAILAKSLEIPTVVGADGLAEAAREGDNVVVDGNAGIVYVRPTEAVLTEYRALNTRFLAFQRDLDVLRDAARKHRSVGRTGLCGHARR